MNYDSYSPKRLRIRRSVFVACILFLGIILQFIWQRQNSPANQNDVLSAQNQIEGESAILALEQINVKGRAPKTGYSRSEFGSGWLSVAGCDMRNRILNRDLADSKLSTNNCIVLSGTLQDPYSGTTVPFIRGNTTSDDIQIDHVVALSDAWQKGAQALDEVTRIQFANDPLNLLAVDGRLNQEKGDSDAASWLPPYKAYRCRYVARQIAVKKQYKLWVTDAEKSVMKRVLSACPNQSLPERVVGENI